MKIGLIKNYQNINSITLKNNKSDWKIQKKEDGVFIPQKRYRFEKICEYIICGFFIIDLIRLLAKK